MLTLAVAGIVAAIAAPNMIEFIRNGRLTSAANDLLRSTQLARSEAIKRRQDVVVCASSNPKAASPTCSGGPFNGWIVFVDVNDNWAWDADEPILERHELLPGTVTVVEDNDAIFSYAPSGFANTADEKVPSRAVVMCDARGTVTTGGVSAARAVLVENTGRSRVTRNPADVASAMTLIGGTCP
jgi:type IV fimbrial biogenesis protein FimT